MMFQVPSHHPLPQAQVSSFHHLPHPQVTSPHLLPETQVSSPNYLSHPPLSSPHLQVTSPHLLPQTHAHSPHPHLSHPASPHFPSPHFELQPQVTLPHLLSPSQQHLYNQNHLLGFDDPNWGGSDPPLEPSFPHLSYTYQNQTSTHLDLQNQTQFGDDLQSLSYVHTLFDRGVDRQVDTPGPAQDAWQPLESPLPQFQCSSLGPVSREVPLGGWSSEDFSSSPSGNFNQFFQEGYYDNSAPQPFCSPNTPGPSPHYPQTPTISSPGPQMISREERVDFSTHTSRSLSGDTTINCFTHTCDSLPVTSDPHQTQQHLRQSHTKLIQDQTAPLDTTRTKKSSLSLLKKGQGGRSTARSPGVTAGPNWRDETGGGERGGGGGGGGGQTSWTTNKQHQNRTKAPDPRLLCTVCKRDFRSLPALNGHMRSHSGSRSAAGLTKVNDSTLRGDPSVSMVMPVSVPIQSKSVLEACRGGQKTCGRLSPATGGAAQYRSLLHRQEEKADADGDAVVAGGDDTGVTHYTPPPMLCPLRAGPGLFCSLTTRGQQLHSGFSDAVAMETSALPPGTMKPRINLGQDNQAEIPPLQVQNDAHADSHNALLVWRPLEELERPVDQQSVEALMLMACSSVMPGGGASPETALQVLSECRGDFLLTVEKLLSNNNNHTAQQSPSVCWSAAERRLLLKSLQLHRKDFRNIQKTVQTKSLSQCVEFYYLWKKKLSLRAKTPAGLTITLPDTNGQRPSKSHDAP
ncbi:mitotic deacetylase-associated SANT domain protein-like [Xyrichtys novacula]|uniref:Mitotic deacetylase-associated SANT domain protein-like n=1 Tax=Xyrichtys novacula TaxID=13765 RepID=A0AAV1HRS2_XYRNO|nr:mitotic deacetylase-associated SANT domain protein-like [Xyrichtys novacula]